MSIDKIPLPAFIHRSLFKNNLVSNAATGDTEITEPAIKISFLGGNENNIVIIAKDDKNKFLNEASMKFLQGLLVACKLTMADVAFINIHSYSSITYEDVINQLKASKLILFGVSANDVHLPFEIPFFQIQNFHGQQYMLSPTLDALQNDITLKKQLWICLQKLFIINR